MLRIDAFSALIHMQSHIPVYTHIKRYTLEPRQFFTHIYFSVFNHPQFFFLIHVSQNQPLRSSVAGKLAGKNVGCDM